MEQTTAMTVGEAMELAGRHLQAGRLKEAEQVYRLILKARPDHPAANHNLGLLAFIAGHAQDACHWIGRAVAAAPGEPSFRASFGRALEAYLAAHPEDEYGARGHLAALGLGETPDRASAAHMERLYAERAPTWPHNAGYRAPQLVAQALLDRIPTPADVLDAGCGTGLVGALIRPVARTLVGVDLSAPMVERAKGLGIYDELVTADLVEHLRARPGAYDAIASAATLIHFGDLGPVLTASAQALRPGGLFAFTLFPYEQDPDGYGVNALDAAGGGVFFHGRNYVADCVARAGFELMAMTDEVHESKDHKPFIGLLVVCRRPVSAA
jgi:predicted TPR repeat methyltransferase